MDEATQGIDDRLAKRRRAIESTAGVLDNAPAWKEWLDDVRSGEESAARLSGESIPGVE